MIVGWLSAALFSPIPGEALLLPLPYKSQEARQRWVAREMGEESGRGFLLTTRGSKKSQRWSIKSHENRL
jgi:hypothetical protein